MLELNGQVIEPGERKIVRIPVGRLPSGNPIYLIVHVYAAAEPGPVGLITGGIHGDEINGVEIVRRAISQGRFDDLRRGVLLVIPIVNVFGFINFSRDLPDGKDINRSFPGNLSGSLASRVARHLTKKVLPLADFGVDFHTGGRSTYNYPQVRFTAGHTRSEELAKAFGGPLLIATKTIPKSLRRVAIEADIPMLVYEGGENLRLDAFSIEKGLTGLQRLLIYLGMLEGTSSPAALHLFGKRTWIRAPRAGMFQRTKSAGQQVFKGEPLGVISDPYGKERVIVTPARDGFIIGHSNAPIVSQGDALFHLAF